MKKNLFAVVAGLVLAASAHASAVVELSPNLDIHGWLTSEVTGHPGIQEPILHSWESYAVTEVAYPDLSNSADAQRAHALIDAVIKQANDETVYVQKDGAKTHTSHVYVGIVARSQADADKFNAWLKEAGYKAGNLAGLSAPAVFTGSHPSNLAVLAVRGIELDHSIAMPFAISQVIGANSTGKAVALSKDQEIWTGEFREPASRLTLTPDWLGQVRNFTEGLLTGLGPDAQITVHSFSASGAKAWSQVFSDAAVKNAVVANDSDANLTIQAVGSFLGTTSTR